MTATNSHNAKVFISYAWGGESERIASEVEKSLIEKKIDFIRDKTNGVGFKGLVKDFMKEIGKGNFVIVVLSDKYLKSKNCMFELLEIHQNGDFKQRIFPIVLSDAKIYDAEDIIDYTDYWDEKIEKLENKIKNSRRLTNRKRVHNDLDLYESIRDTIDNLLDILADMNTLTPEMHQKSNFKQIYEQIETELKAKVELISQNDELNLKQKKIEEEEEKFWEQTKKRNTKGAYERYLILSKLKKFAKEASEMVKIRRIEEMEANTQRIDDDKWKYALYEDNIEAYKDYLSWQLEGKYRDEAFQRIAAFKNNITTKELLPDWLEMIYVEGGSFMMGYDPRRDGENKYIDKAKVLHHVKIKGFFIGKYPVTQNQWQKVMGYNPSYNKGCEECPVEKVNKDDISIFIEKLNDISNVYFRLPTESEWEFAARGGILSKNKTYSGSNDIEEVAWFNANATGTKTVGQKKPNELGLYDICGNVWEWCEDNWHSSYNGAPCDGSAWLDDIPTGLSHVRRGGSWSENLYQCRLISRSSNPGDRSSSCGFRLAFSIS